jgi:Trk K+ transport system NAD-binding subunit
VSRVGHWIFSWVRKPLLRFVVKGSPEVEDIYDVGKGWTISLVTVKEGANTIDLSIADAFAGEDIEVLAMDREGTSINKPSVEEKIQEGDRLLVYGSGKALKRLMT